MEASSTQESPKPSDELVEGAPPGLARAADSTEDEVRLTAEEEVGALDFLLGPTTAVEFDVPVTIETPKGPAESTFRVRQMDGKRIIELEDKHTNGTGFNRKLDDTALDAALVSEATVRITDRAGREVDPRSPEFIGALTPPDPAIAMQVRFKYQPGLLQGIASQVRRISGYDTSKVRSAERALSDAVGKP